MRGPGSLVDQLFAAARRGSVEAVQACVADGADVNARSQWAGRTALLDAAECMQAGCAAALLAAGADVHARSSAGNTALHLAAYSGCGATTAVLLAAGASPAALSCHRSSSPLHFAAAANRAAVVGQLLAADPSVALLRDSDGHTPLQLALRSGSADAAQCLLGLRSQQPAGELLAAVEHAQATGSKAAELFVLLVASRQPLTPAEWERIPGPLPGLAAALPAVLQRSEAEAGLLVRRLPPADRARLRSAALCLGCVRRRRRLPPLPTPIETDLLALCLRE